MFANGAATAAFAYAFSELGRNKVNDPSKFSIGNQEFEINGGTLEEQLRTQTDVRDIISTPRGAEMLTELESRGRVFTIDLDVNNNAYAYLGGDAVFVDPTFHPGTLTTDGVIPATTRRIIAHELGHAVFGIADDGLFRLNNVIQNENPIMNALGQPSRLRY